MIYDGENLNIELTDNREDYINNARYEGLSIVDYGDCEQLLKDKHLLPQDEKLFILNTNVKNSKYNNIDGTQHTIQGLYSVLFDSKGNIVDSSPCTNFLIKIPTDNLLQNQTDYEFMKNSTGADIYNKTDPFFTDFCNVYTKNNSDIVLQARLELYQKEIVCNAGCIYNGIDEHGYALCKCDTLPKGKAFNAARDLIFKLFNIANYKLVYCIMNLFKADLILVYGFFAIIALSTSYLIAMYIHSKFINESDLTKNSPKLIVNDLLDINMLQTIFSPIPQQTGVPFGQENNQQVRDSDAPNLVLNNNRARVSIDELNTNMHRASVTQSPNIIKGKINLQNNQALPIHKQNDDVTRMVNNFIERATTKPVIRNQLEINKKIYSQSPQLTKNINENVLMPATITKKARKSTNIDSIDIDQNYIHSIPCEIPQVIESSLPKKNEAYTVAELAKAPLFVQFEIDERNSFTFYWHELKNSHEILNLYFYKSISTPFHIRLTILFISLSMRLCLSAMFFSDSYIKEQTDYKNKFGPDYTGWWYTLTNDILRILWPMLISVTFKNIMNLFILMSREKLLEMNRFFTGGVLRIREAM